MALNSHPYLGALLVRPDGYVAWDVDRDVKAGDLIGLRDALTQWLGEPTNHPPDHRQSK